MKLLQVLSAFAIYVKKALNLAYVLFDITFSGGAFEMALITCATL
jgi:hypothetical protein